MTTLDNGYHSYFTPEEGQLIVAASPALILEYMQTNPSLALRFIHDLISRNEHQKALDVLLALEPDEDRKNYIDELYIQIPAEFKYYLDNNLPRDQRQYHSGAIPLILALAESGIPTYSGVEKDPRARIEAENKAVTLNLALFQAGLLD